MTVDLASTAPEVKPAAEEPDHTVYYSLGKLTWPSLCDASGWFDAQKMRLRPLPEQTFLLLVMSLARQGMGSWRLLTAASKICGTYSESDIDSGIQFFSQILDQWNSRRLTDPFPFVFLDAYPVRVFSPNGAESSYVLYAIGVSGRTGHRECLGYTCSDGSPKSWDFPSPRFPSAAWRPPISSSPLSFRT